MTTEIIQEMRLHSPEGEPLYLDADDRARFLAEVRKDTNRDAVIFCSLLHYTGARPTELRELTIDRIHPDKNEVVLRTLKKRKKDRKGRDKQPEYRTLPIPEPIMNLMVLAFDLRARQKLKREAKALLWPSEKNPKLPKDAKTVYRWTKRNMDAANITGKKATSKGLRHGFAIAMLEAKPPVPLPNLQTLMGHSDINVTAIYTQAVGKELRHMVMNAWNE